MITCEGSYPFPRSSPDGRLLRLLVPQGARPTSAMHARRSGCRPRGIGRNPEHPKRSIQESVALDHVVADGTIIEAVDNQPWSGEANVHVSIANWAKSQDPTVLPSKRKFWFKVKPSPNARLLRPSRGGRADKEYELDFREVSFISCIAIGRGRYDGREGSGNQLRAEGLFRWSVSFQRRVLA